MKVTSLWFGNSPLHQAYNMFRSSRIERIIVFRQYERPIGSEPAMPKEIGDRFESQSRYNHRQFFSTINSVNEEMKVE